MTDENLKRQVVHGVLWRLLTRLSTQGVTFVVGIVLARMLGPEAYGTIALLSIFVSISEVLINCGFGASLIQRKDITDTDLNSVFYLQFVMSLLFYAILFAAAPSIASFYNNPELAMVLRIQAIILPVNAFRGLQSAVMSRNLWFQYSFWIGMAGVISSGAVGLIMAYAGFGIWALVWSALTNGIVEMLTATLLVRWWPRLLFSFSSLKVLFQYGWKLLASGFVDSVFSNLYGLVIGKFYTAKDLALYNRGYQFPNLAMDTINSSLTVVSFPALSKLQSEPERMRSAMRKMIQVSTFFVMPMLAGMSAVAEPMILLILGEKWRGAIPYVSIACISFAFYPFHTINLQAIKAIGRSDYYLKLSIIKDIVGVIVLFLSCRYSVIVMALAGAFVSTPASLVINSWPNRKLLNYGILSQLHDVVPVLLLSLVMAAIAWSVKFLSCWSMYVTLSLQIVVGVVAFYLLVLIFRPRALALLCEGMPILRKFFPSKIIEAAGK